MLHINIFELTLLHHFTLQSAIHKQGLSFHLILLNVLFSTICYLWVRNKPAWVAINLTLLLFLQISSLYFYFFKSPLSASTILNQASEGLNLYFLSGSLLNSKLTLVFFLSFFSSSRSLYWIERFTDHGYFCGTYFR